MSDSSLSHTPPTLATYHVDEAGDGVLFGRMGRNLLAEKNSSKFFMLGMVRCLRDAEAAAALSELRRSLLVNPLYASINSLCPEAKKTARSFHAKDDHPEIRAKVFELILSLDFQFFAVIKDMRSVLKYAKGRNRNDDSYRYHPNELYDLTVKMLFNQRLHSEDHYRITFARRGQSDRTTALMENLQVTRHRFLEEHSMDHDPTLEIIPAYPWEQECLQITDYCLWALQRCYERGEDRFLKAIWPKVSLILDRDDTSTGKGYGTYLSKKGAPPDPEKIKSRWI
jgi:hypothetical protein